MHKLQLPLLLFVVLFASCTQMGSLNMKEQRFGIRPVKIVWLQVAGFSAEHLALLRFSYPNAEVKTPLENSNCVGNTWFYNLFSLRPEAQQGFFSQMVGKKTVKGECSDYDSDPIWSYLEKGGLSSGIFEIGADEKEQLSSALTCPRGDEFLGHSASWVMAPVRKFEKFPDKTAFFHHSEKNSFKQGSLYYDQSCQKGGCYTSPFLNIKSVFDSFTKNKDRYFFLIRDFSYQKALQSKNIAGAREILREILEIYDFFMKMTAEKEDLLLVLSSSASMKLDFPKQGKEWESFEKKGQNIVFGKTSLVGNVFAHGARAENFCGFFEESEMLMRFMTEAKIKAWSNKLLEELFGK